MPAERGSPPPLPSLATLRGQEPALRTFGAALAPGEQGPRVAPAYLLYGPEGVGRRSGALGFATALLCERPDAAAAPCGACRACGWNAAGTHPDLLLISAETGPAFRDDGAAARGAASVFTRAHHATEKRGARRTIQVRALRRLLELLSLTAVGGARKVVVLDSMDDVEEEGAATLLKSLEEPPPATTFLVLASGLDAVTDTIVSRCQRVRFQPLAPDVVRALLVESLRADDPCAAEDLDLLVRLAQGSAGRAVRAAKMGLLDVLPRLLSGLLVGDPAAGADEAVAWVQTGARDLATQRERARELLAAILLAARDRAHAEGRSDPLESLLPALTSALDSIRANVSPELALRGLWVRAARARRPSG